MGCRRGIPAAASRQLAGFTRPLFLEILAGAGSSGHRQPRPPVPTQLNCSSGDRRHGILCKAEPIQPAERLGISQQPAGFSATEQAEHS